MANSTVDSETAMDTKRSFTYSLKSRVGTIDLSLTERVQGIIKAIEDAKDICAEEQKRVVDWLKRSLSERPIIRIITLGETGVGKSTLLNGLVGTPKFYEAKKLSRGTLIVAECSVQIQGVEITVYDCPGLQDGTDKEAEYMQDLCAKCPPKEADLMLFCMRMDETRKAGHTSAIKCATEFLGKEIWQHAIVVLTFANLYSDRSLSDSQNLERFNARIHEWKGVIQTALREAGVESDIIENIQVQPAGHYRKPKLPGCDYWLSDFWGHTLIAMRKRNQSSLIAVGALERGFQSEQEAASSAVGREPNQQPIVLTEQVKSSIDEVVGPQTSSVLTKIKKYCTIL